MNIAIIRGGHTIEHKVSLSSGQTCIETLQSAHKIYDVVVQQDLEHWDIDDQSFSATEALSYLKQSADVALLMLHGPFGEDGVIQGAFETAGIAYTGSDVQASALANDKFATNRILMQATGMNIPAFTLFSSEELDLAEKDLAEIGYPLVVKPVAGGSSVDTFFADDFAQVVSQLKSASSTGFIAQQCITGMELTCGVLDMGGKTTALDVIEIVPPEGSFFDYEAKYTAGASQEILPARVSAEVTQLVQTLSVEAHRLLGCTGITRSDFILDTNNVLWFLETNTAPGMTATSLVPQELQAAGLDLGDVLVQLCKQGMQR